MLFQKIYSEKQGTEAERLLVNSNIVKKEFPTKQILKNVNCDAKHPNSLTRISMNIPRPILRPS